MMSVQPLQEPLSSLSLSSPSSSSSPFIPTPNSPTLDHYSSKQSKQPKEPSDNPRDFYGNHHRSISVNKGGDEESDRDSPTSELPSFFPPLWLQRRTFICDTLKKEGIRSVADLGCGMGSLISLLSIPAYHLDDFPSVYPPSTPPPDDSLPSTPSPSQQQQPPSRVQSKAEKLSILRSIPHPTDPSRQELHLRKLIGIDQDLSTCQKLVKEQLTLSGEEGRDGVEKSRWMVPEYRWEELEIKLFNGGAESFNECLEDCETLVLTEVVEHMTEQALSKLPNLLFNIYSPRLLIITTPNHLFNPYFSLQNPSTSSTLYPDPTSRTTRVFRDPTHLLEYTPSEFESFCHSLLSQSNCSDEYELTFTGVGNLSSYYGPSQIPFPPPSLSSHPSLSTHPTLNSPISNPQEFNATQIAIYTKRFSGISERSPRSARPVPLPFFTSPTTSPKSHTTSLPTLSCPPSTRKESGLPIPHKLVGSTILPSHPLSSTPASEDSEILEELKKVFEVNSRGKESKMDLGEIWRVGGLPASGSDGDECLRVMCGGEVGKIVEVLLEAEEWRFALNENEEREGIDRLVIEWIGRSEVLRSEEREEMEEKSSFKGDDRESENNDWQVERREAREIQEEMEEREREGVARSKVEGNPDQGGWNDEW